MINIDFTDNKLNIMEYMILQNEDLIDKIIKTFKSNYEDGDDPNDLLTQVMAGLKVDSSNLLPASIKRIENEINNYLEVFHV